MKRFLPTFLVITLVLAIYPFLGREEEPVGVAGLPWQIQLLPDGSTKVFGVVPGATTLGQAVARLGDDMEMAIMAAAGETGSLEMYYSQHRAGLLTAKLILAADIDTETLTAMRENAASKELLKSGATKYVLRRQDHEKAMDAVIQSIAYIPATNLDHETIVNRFGEPAETVTTNAQATHYLYPTKGLDVVLSEEGKEVLQYVAPTEFKRLREPLEQQSAE